MYMSSVLSISAARRRLPELVRKVVRGHPPIAIGRRGKVEAMIVTPANISSPPRKALRGLIDLVDQGLEGADAEIERLFAIGLERAARDLSVPRPARGVRKRGRRSRAR